MTDHRKDQPLENGLRAGMMYSRLESDPRVEMIRNQERDLRVGTTTSQDLARGQGAGMMNLRNLAKDLGVEMTSLQDSEKDLEAGAGMRPDIDKSKHIRIYFFFDPP